MSSQNRPPYRSNTVYNRLYQRFYSNGNAVIDSSASSHWQECARHFEVRSIDEDHFDLAGYGFGLSGSWSFPARVISWAGNTLHMAYLGLPGLRQNVRGAKGVVQRMGLVFSQDAFRQVCTLNLLVRQMQTTQNPERILIIGDGHGILSALLHTCYPSARIFLADLGSVLFFQSYHLHKAFPDAQQILTDEDTDGNDSAVFNFCPADRLDTLPQERLDLAINVASMQEMDPSVISRYFTLLRQHNTQLFYCCNRLDKRLGGGEIARFMDYPWSPADEHLTDGPCPWHQWFFGFGSSPHIRLLGLPMPFMHRYEGIHWHRLTKLSRRQIDD
jgi:hypothetical protein